LELRYGQVEAALADVMDVRRKDMPAFRARLRHLRNIGVPRLPRPGSGQMVEYSRQQALEMLISLELEKIGQAPKQIALFAPTIVRQSPYEPGSDNQCWAVLNKTKPWVNMAWYWDGFLELLQSADDVFVTINVAACIKKLDAALDRALSL
jgi:hypothetical protein